ncbi:hypothetical protein [Amycolatopsis sp. H20-H5]|uniref:hypothetical protein n=1 Tax=Amycolatopsis sp. H20-H5 TaxID=3046309 RepID=UPI002DB9F6E6|nr:hypothetical protein [Amycolatopsis sp. H20-H5]MEC3979907.1 hypothetical protein [Amycolatopsis sp. H20-H5]
MAEKLSFDRLCEAPDWVRNYYQIRLDVELRSVKADGFQRLFDRVMRTVHGRGYRDTAALGRLGDQGCDGYLQSERTVFACYGPDPYFRIRGAVAKFRSDLESSVKNFDIPAFMQKWVFVVNYPGTHPLLINEVMTAGVPGLMCEVWSRTDIVDLFMSGARRQALVTEFGSLPKNSKYVGRAYVVPESTQLPRRCAEAAVQLLRARLRCDEYGYRSALAEWSESVAADPFGALVAQTQLLLGAMGAMVMAGYFDPEKLRVAPLLREAELSRSAWRADGQRAWNLMMTVLHSVDDAIERKDQDVAPSVDPIGEDLDKLLATVVCGNRLALGLIRLYSRKSGQFETECLEEAWRLMLEIPVMQDDKEHGRHVARIKKTGLLDGI